MEGRAVFALELPRSAAEAGTGAPGSPQQSEQEGKMLWLLTHSVLANSGCSHCPCHLGCASLKCSITFAPYDQAGAWKQGDRVSASHPPPIIPPCHQRQCEQRRDLSVLSVLTNPLCRVSGAGMSYISKAGVICACQQIPR